MSFQSIFLIILSILIGAYYVYTGIRILNKEPYIQYSSVTDYILAVILVPLCINVIVVFIKDSFYSYGYGWVILIATVLITVFYVVICVLNIFNLSFDIYNVSEEAALNIVQGELDKRNIKYEKKDGKFILEESKSFIEISSYKFPRTVKFSVNGYKAMPENKEFIKEVKEQISKEEIQPDKLSSIIYLCGAAVLIITAIILYIIGKTRLWI